MSKTFKLSGSLLISLAICFCVLPAQAKYEGGTGPAGMLRKSRE